MWTMVDAGWNNVESADPDTFSATVQAIFA